MICPTCLSEGFAQSSLGPARCEFCDGTFGGNPPERTEHLISSPEGDLHQLEIRKIDELLYITTNNRKMYERWGTFAFDEQMFRQIVEGVEAVLSGATRAITPIQLEVEAADLVAKERHKRQYASASAPAADALNYDDLFKE